MGLDRRFLRAITVLIVFCPCVMVLATPTALVASIGNAALTGSLVKKGATIETLARVTTLIFDKTGTLTTGAPRLVKVIALNGVSEDEVLRSSAIAEKYSEHPLGKAVDEAAQRRFNDHTNYQFETPTSFEALPGMSVEAVVQEKTVQMGKPQLFLDQNLAISRDARTQISERTGNGSTVILSAIEEKIASVLVFENHIRPEAQYMLQQAQALGLRSVLLTGDQTQTVQRVAEQLGIQEVHAEVMPHQKVDVIHRFQQQNQVVAFVGEGINNGSALAAADVGIAMGLAWTDLAIETTEITLLSDDLAKLPHPITLSRKAMKVIRQNLIFSLNVLALTVLLTITGVLNPVTGALLHELSSIPVIANSARLIGLRNPK